MRHTFLLEEGNWRVKGVYLDRDGNKKQVQGETRVNHGPDSWASEGELEIQGDEPTRLQNQYQIAPMGESADQTTWTCLDPREGTIRGTIAVVDDCVISSFRADATDYHGVDVLRKAKNDAYQSRGFAMRDGRKLSSWVLSIQRATNGKKAK